MHSAELAATNLRTGLDQQTGPSLMLNTNLWPGLDWTGPTDQHNIELLRAQAHQLYLLILTIFSAPFSRPLRSHDHALGLAKPMAGMRNSQQPSHY